MDTDSHGERGLSWRLGRCVITSGLRTYGWKSDLSLLCAAIVQWHRGSYATICFYLCSTGRRRRKQLITEDLSGIEAGCRKA